MKIWGNIPKVSGIYGSTNKVDRTSKLGKVASKKDELTISGAAKDFNVVMKALRQVPDIREDRVNEILQKMENGNYSVSSSDIADKMIKTLNL
jgi:negative regulator of flagellin synthesis FlgM